MGPRFIKLIGFVREHFTAFSKAGDDGDDEDSNTSGERREG